MPSAKTECSELSVAFGILGIENPLSLTQDQVDRYFEGSLPPAKYARFKAEFTRKVLYQRMCNVGVRVRANYPLFRNVGSVRWTGPQQQAATTAAAKDLLVANIPISVKAKSNVVQNPSPYNLFESVPRGQVRARSENWYLEQDHRGFQALYSLIRGSGLMHLPAEVDEFERVASNNDRRVVRQAIRQLPETDSAAFYQKYISMCHTVAQNSAAIFNENFSASMRGRARSATLEQIARFFFRMNTVDYILAGIDGSDEFAVLVPDLTKWKMAWTITNVEATPDPNRKQSVVSIMVSYDRKNGGEVHRAQFHAEIRWSHGKFSGNPEAKLYKDFPWNQVAFLDPIYGHKPITRLKIIGNGSFGVVYEALHQQRGERVAIKEFQSNIATTREERARFDREVKIMIRLDHPNILPVLDHDLSSRSSPWFAMPLALANVEDIANELQGNFRRVNHIFKQVLEGTAYAHRQNVIHRDLKPQNILLFAEDRAAVGDFGLGKQLKELASTIALTATDESMGTLAYAAPEQLESAAHVDHRADIYALGKTLLYMLTGTHPLYADHVLPRADERYRPFIERCIQDAPEDRYQSVDEMLTALDALANQF